MAVLRIQVTTSAQCQLLTTEDHEHKIATTRRIIREDIGPELPSLFIHNRSEFGIDGYVSDKGVRVQFNTFSRSDINVPDLEVVAHFYVQPPDDESARIRIREAILQAFVGLIHSHDLKMPNNFLLEVRWAQLSHGYGFVDDEIIQW